MAPRGLNSRSPPPLWLARQPGVARERPPFRFLTLNTPSGPGLSRLGKAAGEPPYRRRRHLVCSDDDPVLRCARPRAPIRFAAECPEPSGCAVILAPSVAPSYWRARTLDGWLPGLTVALHVLTARDDWGLYRDELYYLACGAHPGWGYVDHPPLIGWVAWGLGAAGGTSLTTIRLLPALVAGATVMVQGELTRELGGNRFARLFSQVTTALAPILISLFGVFSMNAFDVLCWATASWLAARLLRTENPRYWLPLGLVLGVGLLNKLSPVFWGFGFAVGLVLTRDWRHLRRPHFWGGVGLAVALVSPHLLWQLQHEWPLLTFVANATRDKNLPISPFDFLKAQALFMNPVAVPIALAGLWWLLRGDRAKPFRALGWAFVAIVALLMLQRSKPYYLAPAYPIAFGAGAVALESWIPRGARKWACTVAMSLVAVTGVLLVPMGKPVLSVEQFVAYQRSVGIGPKSSERKELGRLPQFFADRLGWRELASDTATVVQSLSRDELRGACVFGQNYGQAAALEFFQAEFGLPPVISGHNSYFLWGPGDCGKEVLVVIGDQRERLLELFETVDLGAISHCPDCMPYEKDRPIWICRGPRQPLQELWPEIKNFN